MSRADALRQWLARPPHAHRSRQPRGLALHGRRHRDREDDVRHPRRYGNEMASAWNFPVNLAWASTIHKCRGRPLTRSTWTSRGSGNGAGVRRLESVRSAAGLAIERWNARSIIAEPVVQEFYRGWSSSRSHPPGSSLRSGFLRKFFSRRRTSRVASRASSAAPAISPPAWHRLSTSQRLSSLHSGGFPSCAFAEHVENQLEIVHMVTKVLPLQSLSFLYSPGCRTWPWKSPPSGSRVAGIRGAAFFHSSSAPRESRCRASASRSSRRCTPSICRESACAWLPIPDSRSPAPSHNHFASQRLNGSALGEEWTG